MADGNYAASVGQGIALTKRCTKCGEEKALADFSLSHKDRGDGRRADCKPCRRATVRAWYATSKDAQRKASESTARIRRSMQATPEGRAQRNEWKRGYRASLVAQGLTTDGAPRARRTPAQAEEERRARKAAAEERKADRIRNRKPWNKPWLSAADKFRIRYRIDEVFRATQIQKVQALKVKRAERIAANNDGTVTTEAIRDLFAEATICPYCLDRMTWDSKSLDHVQPLSMGGAHSVENIVVCCKPCNFSKGRKSLISWLRVPLAA